MSKDKKAKILFEVSEELKKLLVKRLQGRSMSDFFREAILKELNNY